MYTSLMRWLFLMLVGLMPAPLAAQQMSDQVVKIGVLTDLSGPAADLTGAGSVLAAQLAVEDFGGQLNGVPIEVVSANHQLKPDIGSELATRWYDIEHVDLIVDVPVSAVGLAVQEVARQKHKLFITHSTGTADFTGKFCSPYGMQWVFDTYALATGTAREVVARGGKTWFFLTADYAFGHSLERDATRVIEQAGGKVIGAVRHPFAANDLSSFILQAQTSKAKIIGIASGPPDNGHAIKLGGEFGIFAGGQQMAGLLVLITDVHGLGLSSAQGLLLTTSFYWDMDAGTRAWSKRFYAKLNKMPTMWQAGVYSSVMHYLNAVKATGTDEPLKVAAAMRERPVEDFFARHGRLRADGLMVHDLYLVECEETENPSTPGTTTKCSPPSRVSAPFHRRARRASSTRTSPMTGGATDPRPQTALRAASGRELALGFDLKALDPQFLADPYPFYRALREHDPIHRMPDGSYFLTRYADCVAVYRDPGPGARTRKSSSGRISATACCTSITPPASYSTIRPIHTRVRKLLAPAFTPRALAGAAAAHRGAGRPLLDAAAERDTHRPDRGFRRRNPAAAHRRHARYSTDERGPLRGWSLENPGRARASLTEEQLGGGIPRSSEFKAYLHDLIARRSRRPRHDRGEIVSTLIASSEFAGQRAPTGDGAGIVAQLHLPAQRRARDHHQFDWQRGRSVDQTPRGARKFARQPRADHQRGRGIPAHGKLEPARQPPRAA